MKRIVMTMAACVVAAVSINAQLLYKISGNDLEKPSYIIGTHHLANVGFVEKINGVKEALTETEQVYGELKWDVMANPDSLKAMQEKMMMVIQLQDLQSLKRYQHLKELLVMQLKRQDILVKMNICH